MNNGPKEPLTLQPIQQKSVFEVTEVSSCNDIVPPGYVWQQTKVSLIFLDRLLHDGIWTQKLLEQIEDSDSAKFIQKVVCHIVSTSSRLMSLGEDTILESKDYLNNHCTSLCKRRYGSKRIYESIKIVISMVLRVMYKQSLGCVSMLWQRHDWELIVECVNTYSYIIDSRLRRRFERLFFLVHFDRPPRRLANNQNEAEFLLNVKQNGVKRQWVNIANGRAADNDQPSRFFEKLIRIIQSNVLLDEFVQFNRSYLMLLPATNYAISNYRIKTLREFKEHIHVTQTYLSGMNKFAAFAFSR